MDERHPPTGTRARRRSRWALRLLALGVALLLGLGLGECAARLLGWPPRQAFVRPPGQQSVLHPQPQFLAGITGRSRYTVNAWGLRGDMPLSGPSYRILALGGSTTECMYLDDTETWPHLLGERLAERWGTPVWVGNAGKSGLAARHHARQLEVLLESLPKVDACIVLVGVNDLSGRLWRDTDYRKDEFLGEEGRARSLREAFSVLPPRWDPSASWTQRTGLGSLLGWLLSGEGRPVHPLELQDKLGATYAARRAARQHAERYRDELPDLAGALAEYERHLSECIDRLEASGVRAVFATQPFLWRDCMPPDEDQVLWIGGVGKYWRGESREYYSSRALAKGMALFNERLLALCARRGVHCVDLAPELPQSLEFFYDDNHFTEAGARRVADHLADALASRLR